MNSKSTHHHKRFEHLLIIRQLVDELEVDAFVSSYIHSPVALVLREREREQVPWNLWIIPPVSLGFMEHMVLGTCKWPFFVIFCSREQENTPVCALFCSREQSEQENKPLSVPRNNPFTSFMEHSDLGTCKWTLFCHVLFHKFHGTCQSCYKLCSMACYVVTM